VRASERLARGCLVLLGLILPFEAPLFRVGPLQITSVELLMYVTLALFAVDVSLRSVRSPGSVRRAIIAWRHDPLARAAVLWVSTVVVCAVLAPDDRLASIKFALRTLCGVLVFFATRSLARAPEVARRVVLALVVGALVSAMTASVESWFQGTAPMFAAFRETSFGSLGLPRASGVFAYPTIGAMYWEAAVSLLLIVPFVRSEVSPKAGAIAGTVAAAALLFVAILASATRSAIAGSAIVCLSLWFLTRHWSASLARASVASLVTLVVVGASVVVLPGPSSLLGQRLRWWNDGAWFGVTYEVPKAPRDVRDGEVFATQMRLRNTGAVTWRHTGDRPTRLAHHWYAVGDRGGETLVAFNGRRTALPADVPPGGVIDIVAVARAPVNDGPYRLAWDLVQEDVTWFSQRGNATGDEPVVVNGAAVAETTPVADAGWSSPPPLPPPRAMLWRAAAVLWTKHPLMGSGPDNFRRRYEAVLSPGPTREPYTDTRIHANSLYFETLADEGTVGVVALLVLGLAWLAALRAHRSAQRVLGLGVGLAAGAFFAHGAFDYFLEFTPTYGLFWMLLGLTSARGRSWPEP
jgi:hypothetical protein